MAFRTEAKACVGLMFLAMAAGAETYTVRHKHLRNGVTGVLRISESDLAFEEAGKHKEHSRIWKYDDIQELQLGPDTLRIVTYEDNRRELGRDRVYLFDKLPAEVAARWYPVFSTHLDQRFVAALATAITPQWQIPAKLTHGRNGSQGVLLVADDAVVYQSSQPGESRTWRIKDLENVSSSDAFDLTITTHERTFRFQLKQVLGDARFQALWLGVNQARGLQVLNPAGGRQ